MPSPCNPNVRLDSDANVPEAEELLQRIHQLAKDRSSSTGEPLTEAIKNIAGELIAEEKMMAKVYERNALLTVQKKREIRSFASKFKTFGDGVLALLQGSVRNIASGRLSVDYQAKALHGKYFGRLVAEMENAGVLSQFKRVDENLARDIYREMGSMHPGQPAKSTTGNDVAFKIAQIVDGVSAEMVSRQNRAGAFIRRLPGYITRQTHDMMAIRHMGRGPDGRSSREASYSTWAAFVTPLIDHGKTFMGANAEKVLRNIHEALYTGIHGPVRDEGNIMGVTVIGSLAKKVSEMRVLHFKDADSAFQYNQAFGVKDFKEQVLHDLHVRARSIALMENLGPSPEATLRQVIRELEEEARVRDDAGAQVDSLKNWKIWAAMDEITGRNEMSVNPTLSNIASTVKVMAQLAKMGAVTLSSLTDKAFLQSEMMYQGLSNLQTMVKQLTGLLPRGKDQKQMLRLMGVAMDSLLGNALSRYSNHATVSGWGHTAQKWFFNVNLLNAWTDANKASAAELMAAHLGEHRNVAFLELPEELRNVLGLYNITPSRWDVIRNTSVAHNGAHLVLPDQLKNVTDLDMAKLVIERGLTPTSANILRERDALETALRTYIMDRVDYAVPTPGSAERKYSTFDTKAGTPLGEAVRMIMLFKSFPITVLRKIMGREIYGRGADGVMDWLLHDHRGKFHLAQLIAMSTILGYMSGAIKDALKGRTPKPLIDDDGKIIMANLNDAAIRGGSLGILGDVLMTEYQAQYRGFLQSMAGPIVGQLEDVQALKSTAMRGQNIAGPAGKLLLDNAPLINLFYIRPILDYLVIWNVQEMLSPGSMNRMEQAVERNTRQKFFIRPSERVSE